MSSKNDWRLPSIRELFAMYDIESNTKVSGFKSAHYWSSTASADDSNDAWIVYFRYGSTYRYGKNYDYFVRCVRDTDNGLELAPSSTAKMGWSKAIEYAESLNIDENDIITLRLDDLKYKEVNNE